MKFVFVAYKEEIHRSCGRCCFSDCRHNHFEESKFSIFDDLDRDDVIEQWTKCLSSTKSSYNERVTRTSGSCETEYRGRNYNDGWHFYVYKNGEKIYDDSRCYRVDDDDDSRPNTVWVEGYKFDEDILYICDQVIELTKSVEK